MGRFPEERVMEFTADLLTASQARDNMPISAYVRELEDILDRVRVASINGRDSLRFKDHCVVYPYQDTYGAYLNGLGGAISKSLKGLGYSIEYIEGESKNPYRVSWKYP